MMGVPGSYDASVYDHLEDKDDEGAWFKRHYGHVPGVSIRTTNVCAGDPLPQPSEVDGLVLAGSYNSVHDHTDWQKAVRAWFPIVRENRIPTLAICGSHQLVSHEHGAEVSLLDDGPHAGTFSVQLTDAGRVSPILDAIPEKPCFHYANSEHVTEVPVGAKLLATSERIPVAALDFGDHFYSTQFHPEATAETLGSVWRNSAPERMENYHDKDWGDRLVENFLRLVVRL